MVYGRQIAKWDSAGNLAAVGSYNGDNSLRFTPTTLSAWNSANGSSWDGKPMGLDGIKGTSILFEHPAENMPRI